MRICGIRTTGDAFEDGLEMVCAALCDMVDSDLELCEPYFQAGLVLLGKSAPIEPEAANIHRQLTEIAKELKSRRARLGQLSGGESE